MPVGADAEPGEVDQPNRDCADVERVERIVRQVLSDRHPQVRQLLGEPDQLLELRRLLLGTEVRVIAVLQPAGAVDAGRLELGPRPRGELDVLPRRRDREAVQPRDRLGVADPAALRVEVAERPAAFPCVSR